MFKVSTVMKNLQHSRIDLIKMNIEGGEYDVVRDIVNLKIDVKQLLVEFHHRFKGVGIQKTKEALSCLNRTGYKIFTISDNGQQYGFIR